MFIRPLFVFLILFCKTEVFGQNTDSLRLQLKNAKHDTTRCNILNQIVEAIYSFSPDSALALSYKAKNLAEQDLTLYAAGDPLHKPFLKCLSTTLNNIGFFAEQKGDVFKALECHSRSLKIREEIGDNRGISESLNNIGIIYDKQGDIPKALECYTKGLKLLEEIDDKKGIAYLLNNIGSLYLTQNNMARAVEYHTKSLKIREEIGDRSGIANSLNNIGTIYAKQDDLKKALEFYEKSLKIQLEIKDKEGIAYANNNIGDMYLHMKNYDKALSYYLTALGYSKELGFPVNIRDAASQLTLVYKAKGDYKNALQYCELKTKMGDSINNLETKKASLRSQFKYAYEKKAAQDSVAHAKESEVKNLELEKQKAEIKAKRNQQYALYGGLAMVIIFAGFMFNRFKVTQKQKTIIEEKEHETQKQNEIITKQKVLVEEKQKEILDSIHYAKRIQTALISSEKYFNKHLNKLIKD